MFLWYSRSLASLVLIYLPLTFHRKPSNIYLKFQCRTPERLLFPMDPCCPCTDRRRFSLQSSTGSAEAKFHVIKVQGTLRCYEMLQTDCTHEGVKQDNGSGLEADQGQFTAALGLSWICCCDWHCLPGQIHGCYQLHPRVSTVPLVALPWLYSGKNCSLSNILT